jgi:hypothetical protein
MVDGVEYIKADVHDAEWKHIIVIGERGWIFEGRMVSDDGAAYRLISANVVRKWSNGRGIGGLAMSKYKDDYTLDEVGSVEIPKDAVVAVIPILEW